MYFCFSIFQPLSLSPGRDFKGHHFKFKKKKSQRKIHVNTHVAFHRGELRAAGVAPSAFIPLKRVQQFQHLAGVALILLSRNGYSESKTSYKPQSIQKKCWYTGVEKGIMKIIQSSRFKWFLLECHNSYFVRFGNLYLHPWEKRKLKSHLCKYITERNIQ